MTGSPLTAAVAAGIPLIVLSAHLADGVQSCGAFLLFAQRHTSVTVATVFTEAASPPYALSTRHHLSRVGVVDAEDLYARRRAQDRDVLQRMGMRVVHVGLADALYRCRCPVAAPRIRSQVPESDHLCPTYRYHLRRDAVPRRETSTLYRIVDVVKELDALDERGLFLAPIGVGRHIDHVLLREAATLSGARVVYYGDFPYNLTEVPDQHLVERLALVEMRWSDGLPEKAALIRDYSSELGDLFPTGPVPSVAESYFEPVAAPSPGRSDHRGVRGGTA